MLGVLLLFPSHRTGKVHALAWWGATFCLNPVGIDMANLGQAGQVILTYSLPTRS